MNEAFPKGNDLVGGSEKIGKRHSYPKIINWSEYFPGEVILEGTGKSKKIALTFDDGPDDIWTPKVLDELLRLRIRATFMCVGSRIIQNPDVFLSIIQSGHEVGNHSWDHPRFTKLDRAQIQDQVEKTSTAIKNLTGFRPNFFRPPYGALNQTVIIELMQLHYKIIYWSVDSLDWAKLSYPQIATNVLSHARAESIVLMHCAGGKGQSLEDTVRALPIIVEGLIQEGYHFVTVSELLHLPAYRY